VAFTTVPTITTGDVATAAWGNTYIKDNFDASGIALVTTDGDMVVATASKVMKRLAAFTGDLLLHEIGGLESDVSAGDGFVEIKGGSTTVIKSKLDATTAPGVSNDNTEGYAIGSVWIDVTGDNVYQAVDVSTGAAVWKLSAEVEEGTWTIGVADDSLDGSGEGQTYTTQVGRYIKIGRNVYFYGRVVITSLGTLTTTQTARIVGLPFTSANVANVNFPIDVAQASSLALNNASESVSGYVAQNGTDISLSVWDVTTGDSVMPLSELSAGAGLSVSGFYEV